MLDLKKRDGFCGDMRPLGDRESAVSKILLYVWCPNAVSSPVTKSQVRAVSHAMASVGECDVWGVSKCFVAGNQTALATHMQRSVLQHCLLLLLGNRDNCITAP